jgi:hypothetical protein
MIKMIDKMKVAGFLVGLALVFGGSAFGAVISTWIFEEVSGEYRFDYELPGEIGGRGLSNVALKIPCAEHVLGVSANVPFRLDSRDQLDQLVIEGFSDDLPEVFTVSLYSLHGPGPVNLGIPEPDAVLFFSFGACLIFLRRNRTNQNL